jgi:CrcB protein
VNSTAYNQLMLWMAVAVGGGLGAMARHGLNGLLATRFGGAFPGGIFVINALGCLAIGLIAGLLAAVRLHIGEVARTFLVVGVLGGFTTFSSFGLDTYTLLRGGHTALGVANALGQVVVGLAAVWAGFALGAGRL